MATEGGFLDQVGNRLSGRIADATSRAYADTKLRTAGHTKKLVWSIMDELFRLMDSEARAALEPWLARVASDPQTPDTIRPLLAAIAAPTGQWQMFAAGSATGALMAGGLGQLLANEIAPATQGLIARNPGLPLSADAAAGALARHIDIGLPPHAEAARNGINSDRFNGLVQLARTYPTPPSIMDLLNRGEITASHAEFLMRRNGYDPNEVGPMLALRHMELSPERLAELVNFGVLPEEAARPIAAKSGASTEDFHRLVLGAGQPPSLEAIIMAWRRGILTEAQVDRAITQGPIRAEWIPAVKALQHEPLPLTEAADAVNQGHLSLDDARQVASLHGVSTEDFDTIVANAGIPPGPQTVLEWVNRGLISEAEALQALYESRIKNKWVPKYLESRFETMPPETVRLMVSRGALSKEDGLRRLQARGYDPETAAIVIDGASREKTGAQRDLTVSQVLELYEDQAISTDDVSEMLGALGYDDQEIMWLVAIRDLRRVRRYMTAVLGRVRAAYVARRMTETGVTEILDRLGVSPEERNQSLALWDVERLTITKGLTVAQVQAALKRGLLTADEAFDAIRGQGYDERDASILVELAQPASR